MKVIFYVLLFQVFGCSYIYAQEFDVWFQDKTLRLDYTFSGNSLNQQIFVDEIKYFDSWYGRRVNLDSLCFCLGTDKFA